MSLKCTLDTRRDTVFGKNTRFQPSRTKSTSVRACIKHVDPLPLTLDSTELINYKEKSDFK